MEKTVPTVSVLIPVYNAEAYLAESIRSILNQTFSDFELILLDDASTDNSVEIIKSFTDKRIRFCQNEQNLGISGSRNRLMDLARGKYLAVMDNDDISLPQRLEKQVAFLEKHSNISIVGTWCRLFSNAAPRSFLQKIKKFIVNFGWEWHQPAAPDIKDALKGSVVMHSAAMLRREDLLKHNIRYNQNYTPAEDYDLWKQAFFAGLKLANIQEVLFLYHLHGSNFSIRKKELMKKADRRIKQEIKQFIHCQSPFFYPYFLVMLQKLRLNPFRKDNHD